jgi:uncharacterized membrane protein
MVWLLFAALSYAAYAACNLYDSYLSNRIFKNSISPLFYESLLVIPFYGCLLLFTGWHDISWETAGVIAVAGIASVLYIWPYFAALKMEETSVVVSYWSLTRLFVPIMAYFIVSERLEPTDYIGFALLTFGNAALNLRKGFHIHSVKALMLMVLSGLVMALDIVLFKKAFMEMDWLFALAVGKIIGSVVSAALVLIPSTTRRQILEDRHACANNIWPVLITCALALVGSLTGSYATYLTHATWVTAAACMQPFMVVFFTWMLARTGSKHYREDLERSQIFKKGGAFALLAGGTLLITIF